MLAELDRLPVGDHRLSCPSCGRGPRDKTLGVTVKPDGSEVAHCFRCGLVRYNRGDRRRPLPPPRRQAPQKRTELSDWALRLWDQCQPISGPAAAYLMARHCAIPPADGDLRWHQELRHPSGYVGPALVALVTHAETCKPLSLHRTWIKPDGTKATDPARLQLAGHTLAGGVIRLWPDEAVTVGLGVAEGIETALSLAHAFQPVWALIDAGHMAKFEPLPGIEAITICQDADRAGIDAARACADAWMAAGNEVRIVEPVAGDVNDMLEAIHERA